MTTYIEQDINPIIQIWIAEDDEELREILGNSLTQEQREVRLFENGQKVLEAVKEASLDILITDLMMPGADGISLLKEVKRFHPDCIVIIMTGYASLDTAIQAIRWGAYDYIRKPFKFDELSIVINNACEKIFLMRENRRLLKRLKEAMEEVKHLRERWDERLAEMLGLCRMISDEREKSEIDIILKQINPVPPDYDSKNKRNQEKTLDVLERLIQIRRDGFIDEEEFISFKKILLEKMKKVY